MSGAGADKSGTRAGSAVPSETTTFPESSFFKANPTSALPTPAEVRAINEKSGRELATNINRPPPVIFPSLGLLVKYGADVSIGEALAIMMVQDQLKGRIPVPEIFGWTEDAGQRFIYMSIIEGDTLEARWPTMDEADRLAICDELRQMVETWRALPQQGPNYIGSLGNLPLNDVFVAYYPELYGPWEGENALQQFQEVCGIEISADIPITFTHSDFVAPNIMLSPGPSPRVAAIIDWGQAGWYPAYWEYCKARRVDCEPDRFTEEVQNEWRQKYLPLIMDPVDDETYYHPWLYFMLTKGL